MRIRTLFAALSYAAAAAHAAVAETAVAPGTASILVRYAVVVGARGSGDLPKTGEVLSDRQLADYLSEWDPNADNGEIRRLFALQGLSEAVRQVASLPPEGGELSGACRIDGVPWRVEFEVSPSAGAVRYSARIFRRDELVSAPTIIARYGERAIVSTSREEDEPFQLFVVVQSDRAAGGEARTGASEGAVTLPVLSKKVEPVYPESEKAAKTQGTVVVALKVGVDGRVRDARVARSLGTAFDAAALDAVRQWQFEPGKVDGKPAEVDYRVTINFVPGAK